MVWHRGCLCGCLYPEECKYEQEKSAVVVHVHHVVHHYEPKPVRALPEDIIDVDSVEIEVDE